MDIVEKVRAFESNIRLIRLYRSSLMLNCAKHQLSNFIC